MIGDIKHIIVIQSLKPDELQSGRELYDDVVVRQTERNGGHISHEYFSVEGKDGFINIMDNTIGQIADLQGGLLIHLEMHGNNDLQGLVFADGSHISWGEIVEKLRPLNVGTCNRLYITMATCFGRYLYKGVDPYKKSPYSGYISASKAVRAQEIIEDFSNIFELLIEKGNLISAFLEMDNKGSDFFYKDSKTTFIENIKNVRDRLDNDPEFKENIIHDIQAHPYFAERPAEQSMIEMMMKMAYNEIVSKQKAAFEFPECDEDQ